MKPPSHGLYRLFRAVLRLAVGFYFRRIERFHPDRVPLEGPLLLVANHPASLADAWAIGLAVPRKVQFVATVRLFGSGIVSALLKACGVIPVNRLADDPRGMRSVAATFEACYEVLEAGGVVGLFPEGITHDEPRLKEIKSGAARMALELEQRHEGRLGLRILPVGLVYSAKERYRADLLISFGEPICVAEHLAGDPARRKQSIRELSGQIEHRIQELILHVPRLELDAVVEGVKRLYLDRLKLGSVVVQEPVSVPARELLLSKAIAEGTRWYFEHHPEDARRFAIRLHRYEQTLARLHLPDEVINRASLGAANALPLAFGFLLLALGLPLAIYGWVHRLAPVSLILWARKRFSEPHKTRPQTATISVLVGAVVFPVFYAIYIVLFHRWVGWPWTPAYAVSLPLTGLIAHHYARHAGRVASGLRMRWLLARAPHLSRRLQAWRTVLMDEIERARPEIRQHLTGSGGIEPRMGPVGDNQ